MSYLTIFFDQMSYLAKCRIDKKSYATNCRIGEMVFDELSCTHLTDPKLDGYKIMRGSRIFFSGGGSMPDGQKRTKYFFFFFFLLLLFCPQLILQFIEGVQWFYYIENYTFPRIQRGLTFSRGVQLFPGGGGGAGVIIISKATHIT